MPANTKNNNVKTQSDVKRERMNELSLQQKKNSAEKAQTKKKDKASFGWGGVTRSKAKDSVSTVPYKKMHSGNILELNSGKFSKTYGFPDINYSAAKQDMQYAIFQEYCKFLNSLPSELIVQASIIARAVPMQEVYDSVLSNPAHKRTGTSFVDPVYDIDLQEEHAEIVRGWLDEGVNNIKTNKYISVTIAADSAEHAKQKFINIESSLYKKFKDINSDCILTEVTNGDRVKILAEIMRGPNLPKGNGTFKDADFAHVQEKAYIAPSGFDFDKTSFEMGKRYGKCMFLRDVPNYIGTDIIRNLQSSHVEMVVSVNVKSVAQSKAKNEIARKLTTAREMQIRYNKKAAQKGVFVDTSPKHITDSIDALTEADDKLIKEKQNLFNFNLLVMFFADTKEELELHEASLQTKAGESSCTLEDLNWRQEAGLESCLPIGSLNVAVKRAMYTDGVAAFAPFDKPTTIQEGGFFFSLHADTKQAIVLNPRFLKSPSGFILGSSGSGKSVFYKSLILSILFQSDDDIIVIDPENESSRFVESFGGQVVELSSTSKNFINPFDIPLEDEDFSSGEHPANLKLDLILSLIEAMTTRGDVGLLPQVNSFVDGVLRIIYEKFYASHDLNDVPTLNDFYQVLLSAEYEKSAIAQELAASLEIFVTGSWSLFSKKTNVNINNRLVSFNTSRIGEHLKPLGSLMVFNAIWSRVAKNRKVGRTTWIFNDEAHLMFNSKDAILRLDNLYRRIRKYQGRIYSITQNTSDVLRWPEARSMVAQADFITVLNQKETERREIQELINIPPSLMSNITNASPGAGIIYFQGMLIPFASKFPKETRLYELITTDPKELAEIMQREREYLNAREGQEQPRQPA